MCSNPALITKKRVWRPSSLFMMGRQDSNLRMTESKSVSLPLADAPLKVMMDKNIYEIKLYFLRSFSLLGFFEWHRLMILMIRNIGHFVIC